MLSFNFRPQTILAAALLFAGCTKKKEAESEKTSTLSNSSFPERQAASVLEQREYINSRRAKQKNSVHLYAGNPVPKTKMNLTVLNNIGYASGYNETSRNPAWVGYRLSKQGVSGSNFQAPNQSNVAFHTDLRTASRIPQSHYSRSGYQRGHLAPNDAIGVNYGEDAQLETYLMSNISPQLREFNTGVWKKLEAREQNFWANEFDEIWIIAGPIISEDPQRIRKRNNTVAVPEKFFKIFIDEEDGSIRMLALVVAQQAPSKQDLNAATVSVSELEALTSLDFNPELPDNCEKELEGLKSESVWGPKKR